MVLIVFLGRDNLLKEKGDLFLTKTLFIYYFLKAVAH